jgi:hypothetical protein
MSHHHHARDDDATLHHRQGDDHNPFLNFAYGKMVFRGGFLAAFRPFSSRPTNLNQVPPPLEHPQVQVQTEVNFSPSPTTVEQLQNLSNTLIEVMQDIHNTEILK